MAKGLKKRKFVVRVTHKPTGQTFEITVSTKGRQMAGAKAAGQVLLLIMNQELSSFSGPFRKEDLVIDVASKKYRGRTF